MAGQLRVDEITDEAGTGSPSFPFGLPVGYAAGGTAPAADSFTEVPSNVLEVGDPIRSVDILAIKENTNYNHQNTVLEILNEQTFSTSGTWTKPLGFDPDDTIIVIGISGGGGGGIIYATLNDSYSVSGGNGGNVAHLSMRYADAPSSAPIIIGAGGAGLTANSSLFTTGNLGGDTVFNNVFANDIIGYLNSKGGIGGLASGSTAQQPNNASTNQSRIFFPTATTLFSDAISAQRGNSTINNRFSSLGRAMFSNNDATDFRVGKTGGGGAVANQGTTFRTKALEGHKGTIYGEGGNAAANGNGTNGGFPGGGGGSVRASTGTVTTGSGGNGQMFVYVCRGRVSASQFVEFSVF